VNDRYLLEWALTYFYSIPDDCRLPSDQRIAYKLSVGNGTLDDALREELTWIHALVALRPEDGTLSGKQFRKPVEKPKKTKIKVKGMRKPITLHEPEDMDLMEEE
jgi:hypothetical protein